jgi:hypothetical protein
MTDTWKSLEDALTSQQRRYLSGFVDRLVAAGCDPKVAEAEALAVAGQFVLREDQLAVARDGMICAPTT